VSRGPRATPTHIWPLSGVRMIAKPIRLEEILVIRRLATLMGLIAGLAPAMFAAPARAQVNIDQGKSPAEIYSSDCATCHKTPRGLAVGKNSLMLSSFLREHYTASAEQASALAAYVLGAGGREPAPAAPKQKPEVEHARIEEPKGQARGEEPRLAEPKAAAHPVRTSAKPEEEKPPQDEAAKHEERPSPASAEKHEAQPETASRGEKTAPEETAPPTPEAAPVVAAPAANETPSTAETSRSASNSVPSHIPNIELGSTTAAVPPEQQPSAAATVPRDNIPD